MNKWEYTILSSWWVEEGRSDASYLTTIGYKHVWAPGPEAQEYCSGMTEYLGSEGWELVTITTSTVTLMTVESPQGRNEYGSFPVHKVFFKRPAA